MSRIGKNPVTVPSSVTVTLDGQNVSVKGPKGELHWRAVDEVTVSKGDDGITITPRDESKRARAMWGLGRALINNLVIGVTEGFSKTLEINGVGYRATANGKTIDFSLGLSHPLAYTPPEGVELKVTKPTEIIVSGIDKQKVGQVAANIRGFRPPEPYQGKGIKYADEIIVRKEGKKKK